MTSALGMFTLWLAASFLGALVVSILIYCIIWSFVQENHIFIFTEREEKKQ